VPPGPQPWRDLPLVTCCAALFPRRQTRGARPRRQDEATRPGRASGTGKPRPASARAVPRPSPGSPRPDRYGPAPPQGPAACSAPQNRAPDAAAPPPACSRTRSHV